MNFLHPGALALFALGAILIFLAFLRALTRQQPVSSLALWSGLTQSPERQRPKLHRWAEPLLFVQLLALTALVFAVAEPMSHSRQSALRGLALIVDETASMRTTDDAGGTRFSRAISRARDILAAAPASQHALVQFSSRSQIAVPPTPDPTAVERALGRLEPSWRGDGASADLLDLLSAMGGLDRFDRVVLLTDHTPADLPPAVVVERFDGGENVGISAFAVRENPVGLGVSAFIELRNDTAEYLEPRVVLQDEYTSVTVTLPVGPESVEQYVSPLSASRGSRFIASMAASDDFAGDNARYFSLDRPAGLRVRWIGDDSLYLRAAIESSLQAEIVEATDAVDLTVVVGRTVRELPPGNILLLASDAPALFRFGDVARPVMDAAHADDPGHPLLAGVDAHGIYVETLPETSFLVPGTPVLTAGGLPLLTAIEDGGRVIYVFSTDLRGTNLPITVEFPVIVRNLLSSIARTPSPLVHEWLAVGDVLSVATADPSRSLRAPDGRAVSLDPVQSAVVADQPGFYELQASGTVRFLAVNVPAGESFRATAGPAASRPASASTVQEVLRRMWPGFAWLGLALLAVEAGLYVRFDATRRFG